MSVEGGAFVGPYKEPVIPGASEDRTDIKAGINLVELLTGDVNRLRYIQRFGTALTLHKENVAEHSFYVAFYSLFIARWYANQVKDKDWDGTFWMGEVLGKALLHDVEECRTGDFPRPFKYRRKELKEMLDAAAKEEFAHIARNLLPGDSDSVGDLVYMWEHGRDETRSGCIVALADYLSVVSHLWQEVNGANLSMYEHYDSVMAYLGTFKAPCYDFIREIIDETERITTAVFDQSQRGRINV